MWGLGHQPELAARNGKTRLHQMDQQSSLPSLSLKRIGDNSDQLHCWLMLCSCSYVVLWPGFCRNILFSVFWLFCSRPTGKFVLPVWHLVSCGPPQSGPSISAAPAGWKRAMRVWFLPSRGLAANSGNSGNVPLAGHSIVALHTSGTYLVSTCPVLGPPWTFESSSFSNFGSSPQKSELDWLS